MKTQSICILVVGALLRSASGLAAPGEELISSERLLESVKWLADDAREGRMTGSEGARAAAEWIAERFREIGLEPLGDDGTYYQGFEASIGLEFGPDNAMTVYGVEGLYELEFQEDYALFGFSGAANLEAPLVFVGYGITDEKNGYDDYAGMDVRGKAVLMLRHEPQQQDPKSVFNGREHSKHAFFRNKALNAFEHGAAAMILFTGPASREYRRDPLVRATGAQKIGDGSMPAVQIKRDVGIELFEHADVDLHRWTRDLDKTLIPNSFAFDENVKINLSVDIEKKRAPARNVVGMLPGRDPGAGSVIVGAHYDHLGLGGSGSLAPSATGTVHNGADDNASGTAAVVELARVFAETDRTRRNLIFVAFSGEEQGLLGSSYMADNPPVRLDRVQAMVNLDMVGRPKEGTVTVSGVGTSEAFDPLIARLRKRNSLRIETDEAGIGPSDHTSFFIHEVPVLHFFSGLHQDYHRPSDDWKYIDPDGFTEVTRMVHEAVRNLADRKDRIELYEADEREVD